MDAAGSRSGPYNLGRWCACHGPALAVARKGSFDPWNFLTKWFGFGFMDIPAHIFHNILVYLVFGPSLMVDSSAVII